MATRKDDRSGTDHRGLGRRHLLTGAAALAAAGWTAGRSGGWMLPAAYAQAKPAIKMGIATDITGAIALQGNSNWQVAQLAVEQINKAGGVAGRQIELFLEALDALAEGRLGDAQLAGGLREVEGPRGREEGVEVERREPHRRPSYLTGWSRYPGRVTDLRTGLRVGPTLTIPEDELHEAFSRSGGSGGQNVNKVSSKAVLHWDVLNSPSLPPDVRGRFVEAYPTRITKAGEIVIHSEEYRDQPKNIQACYDKLRQMIVAVLRPPKKRRPTKPTKGSKVRRLKEKKARSETKAGRRFRGE